MRQRLSVSLQQVLALVMIAFLSVAVRAENPPSIRTTPSVSNASGEAAHAATAAHAAKQARRQALLKAVSSRALLFLPGSDAKTDTFVARNAHASIATDAHGLTINTFEIKSVPAPKPAAGDAGANMLPPAREVRRHSVRVDLLGANLDTVATPLGPNAARTNFFTGSDPAHWRHNVLSYDRVRYTNVYKGVDLTYYGRSSQQLEYDFVVAPGADPASIRLHVDGSAKVDADGNLRLSGEGATEDNGMALSHPVVYQDGKSGKEPVTGNFIELAKNTFGFSVGSYDHSKPLVIDPEITVIYASYMGGLHDDEAADLVLDANGAAYITGYSASEDFPISGNAYQVVRQTIGAYLYDAFVMKFDASGNLIYSTFLGGAQNDEARTIQVDSAGDAYIAGYTQSADFPVTSGAYQKAYGGGSDAFLTKFSNDGSQLLYSTYLGGAGDEAINRMRTAADGSLWVGGDASAAGLPVSATAAQKTVNGSDDGFIAKLQFNTAGALQIPYLTFLGGSNTTNEEGLIHDLDIDSTGNIYVTGESYSADFPVTGNAYEQPFPLSGGCYNSALPNGAAFITKFSPDLSKMLYSTVVGGKTEDQNGYPVCNQYAGTIHVDSAGNMWLIGTTGMSDFPTTANAMRSMLNGNGSAGVDNFIFELSADGSKAIYSSLFGGSQFDYGSHAVWDSSNNIWVAGTTQSTDFPVTSDALQPTNAGGYDTEITEFSPDGTKIEYATYLGGAADDDVSGAVQLRLDAQNNIHLAGETASTDYPVTPTAFQPLYANGDSGADTADAYYTILGSGIIGSVGPVMGGNTGDTSVTVNGAGFQKGATCSLVEGSTTLASAYASVNSTGTAVTCTFSLTGAATGSYDVVVNNPDGSSYTRQSSFTVQDGQGPDLNVSIVGRSAIRVGTATAFELTVSNTGDANAYGVLVNVTYPTTATLTFAYGTLPPLPSGKILDYNAIPKTSLQNGLTSQVLFLPLLTAGASNSYSFQILDSTQNDSVSVTASAAYMATTVDDSDSGSSVNNWTPRSKAENSLITAHAASAGACFGHIVGVVANAFGVPGCLGGSTLSVLVGTVTGGFDGSLPNPISNGGAFAGWLAGNIIPNCAGVLGPVGAAAGAAYNAWQALGDCGGGKYQQAIINFLTKGAIDPNEKDGPTGDGSTSHYVRSVPLAYNVAFENEASATAPASQVVVTDQLDPTKVDLTTLTLGSIQIGGNVIGLPQGTNSYNTNYKQSSSLNVRVQGSLDQTSGLLKWTFTSIDPATGQPPTDPTVGFLPPDTNGIIGQASVTFNVMPISGQSTGTQISNKAAVVFDSNAALNTATWVNTLDVTAPASAVTALNAQVVPTFPVSWSGTDKGSGIGTYNVYVSDNGGAFTLWQKTVDTTSASYTGTVGHTYGFYSIATDKAGNSETAKTKADTETMVVASIVPPAFTLTAAPGTLSIAAGSTGSATISVKPTGGFNQAVAFTCSGLPANATCSFSPASVTPNGSAAATTQMTIATSVEAALVDPSNGRPWNRTRGSEEAALAALLGLGGLARARRRAGRWMQLAVLGILVALSGFAGMGLSGCGGGGSSSSKTPPSTSNVTVTATSGSLKQTASLTLTVQ